MIYLYFLLFTYLGLSGDRPRKGPCMESMKSYYKILKLFKNKLQILSFNDQNTLEQIQKIYQVYNQDKNPNWHFLYIPKTNQYGITNFFGINGYPTYILLSPEGTIISDQVHNSAAILQTLGYPLNLGFGIVIVPYFLAKNTSWIYWSLLIFACLNLLIWSKKRLFKN